MRIERLARMALVGFALCAANAQAHRPHVHGEAELNVAVARQELLIEFVAPTDSLLGFEHAPRNEAEHAAVAALRARLADGAALFRTEPTCSASAIEHEDPFATAAAAGAHSDIVLRIAFTCDTSPRSLTVELFDAFPAVERIRAQYVTDAGQGAATLTRAARRLSW